MSPNNHTHASTIPFTSDWTSPLLEDELESSSPRMVDMTYAGYNVGSQKWLSIKNLLYFNRFPYPITLIHSYLPASAGAFQVHILKQIMVMGLASSLQVYKAHQHPVLVTTCH